MVSLPIGNNQSFYSMNAGQEIERFPALNSFNRISEGKMNETV